jgi:hypothetical protein
MKPVYIILAIAVILFGYTPAAHAQFLKNLVNNVKQNIGNKPTSTTKKDSAASTGPDSAAFARMMAGINKPAPMTAADSAAVKSFMTASGGSGMLYQYQLKYDIKTKNKDTVMVDTTSQIISDSHCTHFDMNMLGMKMTVLGHDDQHKYSVMLYPESKSYKLNAIDTARLIADQKKMNITVTKIGNETVAGYPCVHSKLTMVTPNGNKPITVTEELWTSNSVPGYAQIKQLMSTQNITFTMLQKLDQAGCDGFVVKMTMASESINMNMILITADRKTFPASTFEIPAGYVPMTGMGMMNGLMNGMSARQKQ